MSAAAVSGPALTSYPAGPTERREGPAQNGHRRANGAGHGIGRAPRGASGQDASRPDTASSSSSGRDSPRPGAVPSAAGLGGVVDDGRALGVPGLRVGPPPPLHARLRTRPRWRSRGRRRVPVVSRSSVRAAAQGPCPARRATAAVAVGSASGVSGHARREGRRLIGRSADAVREHRSWS